MSIVNSYNEWDPLEEVVVGTAVRAGAYNLFSEPVMMSLMSQESKDKVKDLNFGTHIRDTLLDKAIEELDNLQRVLQNEGVVVKRPDDMDYAVPFTTPDFESVCGNNASCPRDLLMVVGDRIIEASMSMKSRFFEYRAYRSLVKDYFMSGAKWVAAPKPLMGDDLYRDDYVAVDFEEDRLKQVLDKKYVTTEFEPCFDAADFMRFGKDIIAQRSQATNEFGIEWVRRYLGDDYRVHSFHFVNKAGRHTDDTLVPVRPGIVLYAEDHPPQDDKLELFTKSDWRTIPVPPSENGGNMNLNFLSVNENTVIIEEQEKIGIEILQTLGCRVIPVPMRHMYSCGGGPHCATVDIRRRGTLQSYFPHLDQEE